MDQEVDQIAFDELVDNADNIFAQIDAQGTEILVEREGRLYSLKPRSRRGARRRKPRVLTAEDSLLNIVGMIDSPGPTDVSANKHKYIAEGFLEKHMP